MNSIRFARLVFVFAIFTLIVGVSACDQIGQLLIPEPPQMEEFSGEIVIGLVYPVTGRLGSVGMEMGNGFELALEEINNSQLGNTKLKFITEDSQGNVEGAIAAFNKLIHQDGVSIILGPGMVKCSRGGVSNCTTEWGRRDKPHRRCPWTERDWRFCVSHHSHHRCVDNKRHQGNTGETRLPESGNHI